MAQFIKSKKYIGVIYCLLKNKDKSYYITYKINSKFKRLHIGKQSEGINETFCNQKRNEAINRAKFGDDSPVVKTKKKSILFSIILNNYFEYSEVQNKSHKNQLSRYNTHLKSYFEELTIDEITPILIEKIQRDKSKKLSAKTVNHIIQTIGTIFNHAIDREIIKTSNPAKKIKKLVTNNQRLRYLNTEEINELFTALKDDAQLYLFTKLLLNTGARLRTVVSIKKKDIDFENKIVTLLDYKNQSNYKGFLQDETAELLKLKTLSLKSNDYILLDDTRMNNLYDLLSRRLRPILNKLFNQDLDKKDSQNRVVTHTLRHTFASHLAINGTPIFTIQNLMNHKDIKMTMRYAKLAPDSGREFVNELYT